MHQKSLDLGWARPYNRICAVQQSEVETAPFADIAGGLTAPFDPDRSSASNLPQQLRSGAASRAHVAPG